MNKLMIISTLAALFLGSCSNNEMAKEEKKKIQLVTLDPGHFHAALVQKTMYDDVDSVVHVYAPEGSDVKLHLDRINTYNSRPENPTKWKEEVYTGKDFLQKMSEEKGGNVVIISGNNFKKTEYITESLNAGFNVLADKPMVVNAENFSALQKAFQIAKEKDVLLYDIMTERHEITTILQKELSQLPEIFGVLEKGTPQNPAVTKESVHHFYKYVSGTVLTRPAWFMDVTQQGEGIVDVTTHLVDLVQWECFPEQTLSTGDVQIVSARRWTTDMRASEFNAITKLDAFPDYLKKDVANDSILKVYSNGEINYTLKGVHAKVSVIWAYKAPAGTGDTHYSIMRGSKANLVIRQGAEQQYKPALYIEPIINNKEYETALAEQIKKLTARHPGIELKKNAKGWEVLIPEKYKEGHEAHFAMVTESFLNYLKNKNMPAWEVPNMLTKYYTTTQALELAKKGSASK